MSTQVTDKGLIQVVTICHLQHLLTRACQGITDTGMYVLYVCVCTDVPTCCHPRSVSLGIAFDITGEAGFVRVYEHNYKEFGGITREFVVWKRE